MRVAATLALGEWDQFAGNLGYAILGAIPGYLAGMWCGERCKRWWNERGERRARGG